MTQCIERQSGFTLVEMIVALAVFATVITISVGALLMLIATNEQLQAEQSVMTNLSFALDSMTREIRTGTHYFCDSSNSPTGSSGIFNDSTDLNDLLTEVVAGKTTPKVADCNKGNKDSDSFHGLAFNEGGSSITGTGGRILYYFDKNEGKIFRKVGSGQAQSIVSSGIFIENAEFYVTGSKPLSAGGGGIKDQAAVTVFVEARESNQADAKLYQIQTTVVQRTLDI